MPLLRRHEHIANREEGWLGLTCRCEDPKVFFWIFVMGFLVVVGKLACPPASSSDGVVVILPPFIGELKNDSPARFGFHNPLPTGFKLVGLHPLTCLKSVNAEFT